MEPVNQTCPYTEAGRAKQGVILRLAQWWRHLWMPKVDVLFVIPNENHAKPRSVAPIAPYVMAHFAGMIPKTITVSGPRNGANETTVYCVRARYHDETSQGTVHLRKLRPTILLLSSLTPAANRMRELAEIASHMTDRRGFITRVFCGGFHATSAYPEVLRYAYAFCGEMDAQCLEHLLVRLMQSNPYQYKAFRKSTPQAVPFHTSISWRGISRRARLIPIRVGVGCPRDCSFCAAWQTSGRKHRFVCTDCLKQELRNIPRRLGLFKPPLAAVDDNLIADANPQHLYETIVRLAMIHDAGFRWIAETGAKTLMQVNNFIVPGTLQSPKIRQFLVERGWNGVNIYELMRKLGCIGLFFGMESLRPQPGMSKQLSPEDMKRVIELCHKAGLGVLGAWVLGLPGYHLGDAKMMAEFCDEAGIDALQASIAVPILGSADFYSAFVHRNITTFNWSLWDGSRAVQRFEGIEPWEIERELQEFYDYFYSWHSLTRRVDWHLLFSFNRGDRHRAWLVYLVCLSINYYRQHRFKRTWQPTSPNDRPIPIDPALAAYVERRITGKMPLFNPLEHDDADVTAI